MFQTILVPLDGTAGSERAIPVAARLARASGGSLVFLRVALTPARGALFGPEPELASEKTPYEPEITEASTYLMTVTNTYADELAGISVQTEVATGGPAPAVFFTAQRKHVDLIVLCSHDESGLKRWVLGSMAHEAAQWSPVPVVLLHERGASLPRPERSSPLRLLIALDGSELAEAALEPAITLLRLLAPADQSELHLLSVVDIPFELGRMHGPTFFDRELREQVEQDGKEYLEQVCARLRRGLLADQPIPITTAVILSTNVPGAILTYAERSGDQQRAGHADLITLATHGRSGVMRLLMGSVTEEVMRRSTVPLLIVRPQAHGVPKAEEPVSAEAWSALL